MTQTGSEAGGTSGRTRPRGRTRAEQAALRALARSAAEAGEPLAAIASRLHIPDSTLSDWALADGFRTCDLKARAEAAAAEGGEVSAIASIRQETDGLWEMCEEFMETPSGGARRIVDVARARALALADAGYYDAAEAEIAAVRQLARILAFGRAGTAQMEKIRLRAVRMAENREFRAIIASLPDVWDEEAPEAEESEADEADRAAREAAGLPYPPQLLSDEDLHAFLQERRARRRAKRGWGWKAG